MLIASNELPERALFSWLRPSKTPCVSRFTLTSTLWCRMNVSPTKTAEELIKRFDWQFKAGPRICGSVPPSWNDVLFDLMLAIENLLSSEEQERFWWTDIKEKRGELRAYYVNDNEEDREWEVASLVEHAESHVEQLGRRDGVRPFSPNRQ